MKAVVYKGKNKVAVEEVSDPKIEAPGDAIIRITTAAICGSDLHMYDERSNAEPGTVFGHENQGVVEDIGKALGVEYQDNEELKGSDKVAERDRHRWELDPASSEDYKNRK